MARGSKDGLEIDCDMESLGEMRQWRAASGIPGIKILNDK